MSKNKFHLLHVRVTADMFDQLHSVVASRPSANVSDIVREAITLVTSEGERSAPSITLSGESYKILSGLASELNRSASKVAEECVFAVADSFQQNRSPLIVEELKLRREYSRLQ